MSARVILHLPEPAMGTFRTMPTFGIHSAIERLVLERGGQVLIVPQGNKLFRREPLPGDGDLHVVEYGRASGPGYLNAAAAYFDGFFHLDPEGVLAEASTRHLTYNAGAIDQAKAEAFMNWLKSRFADQRHSRHRQKKAVMRLPKDSIAVFLQGPMPELRGHAHMSTADMLRAVTQGARGRPVVVKPHPLKPDLGAEQIARAVAEGASLLQTDANVHDILAAAAVTVSINSATGFEGFLHAKPAIFFGRTDFHQCVETVQRPEEFPHALERALTRKSNYAEAMYWYFGQHGFWLDDLHLNAKLLALFDEAGFSQERLGLDR